MNEASSVQIIRGQQGEPLFAVLEWNVYARLDPINASIATTPTQDVSHNKGLPAEILERLRNHEHPIKVFREYRGLTQVKLAAKVKTSPVYLSQIETGGRQPSHQLLSDLARVLDVDYDLLVGDDMPLPEPLVARPLGRRLYRISTLGQAIDWAQEERDRYANEEGPLAGHETRYAKLHWLQNQLRQAQFNLDTAKMNEIFPDLKRLVEGSRHEQES